MLTLKVMETDKEMVEEPTWWAESMQYSGMLGWLPTTVMNTLRWDVGRPLSFVPAMQIVDDLWSAAISKKPSDKFFKSLDSIAPFPTVRNGCQLLEYL